MEAQGRKKRRDWVSRWVPGEAGEERPIARVFSWCFILRAPSGVKRERRRAPLQVGGTRRESPRGCLKEGAGAVGRPLTSSKDIRALEGIILAARSVSKPRAVRSLAPWFFSLRLPSAPSAPRLQICPSKELKKYPETVSPHFSARSCSPLAPKNRGKHLRAHKTEVGEANSLPR